MKLEFENSLSVINGWLIIQLPIDISKQLPSRGMVMGQASINDFDFLAQLEPDGRGSHWFSVPEALFKAQGLSEHSPVTVSIEPLANWPSPELPANFEAALKAQDLMPVWDKLTPKSQWEWLRWVRASANADTRQKRIQTACDKLLKGSKRPCCFDASRCSVPEVCRAGVLVNSVPLTF